MQLYENHWYIEYKGQFYEIKEDTGREYLQPKWYVQRMDNLQVSRRYYSRPSGAFLALSTEAITWEDQ